MMYVEATSHDASRKGSKETLLVLDADFERRKYPISTPTYQGSKKLRVRQGTSYMTACIETV